MRYHSIKRRRSTTDLRESRRLVGERSEGACEVCGQPLPVLDDGTYLFEFQHRQAKQRHGANNSPENGLACHPICHQMITGNPDLAVEMGWSVEQHRDPARVPVMIAGRPCLLDAEGGATEVAT